MQLNTERSPRLLCVKIPTVYKKQQPRDRRLCHLLWERLGKRAAGQHGSVRDSRERGQSRSPGSSGQTALRYRRRAPRDAGGRCRQTLVSRLHPELNQLQSFGARAGLLQICTGKLDQKSPFLCILTNSRRSVQTKTPPARAGPSRGRLFAGSAWSPLLVNWITTGSAANSPCSECLTPLDSEAPFEGWRHRGCSGWQVCSTASLCRLLEGHRAVTRRFSACVRPGCTQRALQSPLSCLPRLLFRL